MKSSLWPTLILAALLNTSPALSQEPKTITFRFYAPVNVVTISKLLSEVDQKVKQGYKRIVLLISSPGGDVFAGLTAYNYLKGIPAEIITHNFGAVDSIAAVIFCAGTKRYMVPQGRFVIHPVALTIQGANVNLSLDEVGLQEKLRILRQDELTIATVIANSLGKKPEEIRNLMLARTLWDAKEAEKWGLVHEQRVKLYEENAEVITIGAVEGDTKIAAVPLTQTSPILASTVELVGASSLDSSTVSVKYWANPN